MTHITRSQTAITGRSFGYQTVIYADKTLSKNFNELLQSVEGQQLAVLGPPSTGVIAHFPGSGGGWPTSICPAAAPQSSATSL